MAELWIPDIMNLVMNFSFTAIQIATLLGFGSGVYAGEAFSGFDGLVKYGVNGENTWFEKLSPWEQRFLSIILDMSHHFQYGLAMVLIAKINPLLIVRPVIATIISSYGWGLVASDWKDFENVLERLGFLSNASSGTEDKD